MLISGPAEWSEALIAAGVKGNLLQDGYNPGLQVSAMPLGPTVAITRYSDTDTTPGFGRGILDQPTDTLVLHEGSSNSDRYRLVAWSRESTETSLLAIASTTQVEIWEVTAESGISATLRGSVDCDHLQGLAWNPRNEVLLAYSRTDILLITTSEPVLSWRVINTDRTSHSWNSCSWSPCGLQVSLCGKCLRKMVCFLLAQLTLVLPLQNAESCPSLFRLEERRVIALSPPRHDQIDASSSLKGTNGLRLDVENAGVGPIAAVAHVSPTVCILTTNTKLVLEEICRAAPALNSMLRNTISIETSSVSSLIMHPRSCTRPDTSTQEHVMSSPSDIIDLTSIRVSTRSAQSSLQILNRPEVPPRDKYCTRFLVQDTSIVPRAKPRSHVLLVEFKAQQWSVISILDLPHLTSPDVLVVQGMRVVVGSTLSPHLIVAHLDVSDRVGWTASLSGELELPPTHLCRGIYLAERSPFAEVASTEKRKRATFFHAAANNEPQPIYLSKFKVPRRVGPTYSLKSTSNGQESPARPDKTSRSSEDESGNSGESKDLLELILVKMTAMQTQLNARFDDVDKKLHQLAARVEQLERNGGTNAK
ncbi:WD40/YVTN repeat-like-containing domain [Phytophthora cactorum]|nr:WD40/YVTN repeat-like-containing domain [Phytophthora cactorum]